MLGHVLIRIARDAISDVLHGTQAVEMQRLFDEYPELQVNGASFVTLTLNGRLRGCIGSISPFRPLLEDIITNACSAAFKDPRFMPLTPEEFESVEIEVSLLTQPQRFEYASLDELKERVSQEDGVILKEGPYQATFLPQVWEQLPSFELFFSHLCEKAGLNSHCLDSHPEIYLYQVQKYKE